MAIGKYDTAGLCASHSPHPGKLVLNIYHDIMRAILPLSLVFIPLPSSFPSLPLSLSVYRDYFPLTRKVLNPSASSQRFSDVSKYQHHHRLLSPTSRVSDSAGLWAQDLAFLTCTPGDFGAAGRGTL